MIRREIPFLWRTVHSLHSLPLCVASSLELYMKCYRTWGDRGDKNTVNFNLLATHDVTGPGRWCVTVAFCGLISSSAG